MKQLLTVISVLLLQSCSNKANDLAEFHVTDVSKPIMFIDSITGGRDSWLDTNHVNVDMIIVGQLDSSATVSFGATDKNYSSVKTMELNRGTINLNHKIDYYGGDAIWIKFTPQGSNKGHLTIKTRVN